MFEEVVGVDESDLGFVVPAGGFIDAEFGVIDIDVGLISQFDHFSDGFVDALVHGIVSCVAEVFDGVNASEGCLADVGQGQELVLEEEEEGEEEDRQGKVFPTVGADGEEKVGEKSGGVDDHEGEQGESEASDDHGEHEA